MPSDRRKLGYWNLERIRRAEEAAKLIRQKVGLLLEKIEQIHPADRRMKLKLNVLEIDRQAADIYISISEIEVEPAPSGSAELTVGAAGETKEKGDG